MELLELMTFLREVFSEDSQGSASRCAMFLHAFAGISWISLVVWKTHAIPDAATLAGVTAFVVAPYAINKFGSAVDSLAARPKPQ